MARPRQGISPHSLTIRRTIRGILDFTYFWRWTSRMRPNFSIAEVKGRPRKDICYRNLRSFWGRCENPQISDKPINSNSKSWVSSVMVCLELLWWIWLWDILQTEKATLMYQYKFNSVSIVFTQTTKAHQLARLILKKFKKGISFCKRSLGENKGSTGGTVERDAWVKRVPKFKINFHFPPFCKHPFSFEIF